MTKPLPPLHLPATAFFCISMNPAIDTRLVLDEFVPGAVNRAREVFRTPGGKAAHVAMALQGLGAVPTWIGFSGGATGNELLAGLRLLEIKTIAAPTVQSSRVNLEIVDVRGGVTEVLEPGATVTSSEWDEFQRVAASAFQREGQKIVALSGSVPPGLPADACATLINSARSANCLAMIDTSGLPLSKALAAGPDLVKINREEAESITQMPIRDPVSAAHAVRKLLKCGARSAAISLGNRGIIGVEGNSQPAVHAWTEPLHPKSTVGCGDAALAGLAFATASGLSFEQRLAMAVACGAANCLATLPGRIKHEDISRVRERVHIERLQEQESAR